MEKIFLLTASEKLYKQKRKLQTFNSNIQPNPMNGEDLTKLHFEIGRFTIRILDTVRKQKTFGATESKKKT